MTKHLPRHLETAEEAWDAAEKLFADLGIEWALTRSGEHFHMMTSDGCLRVAAEPNGEHGWIYVVLYKPQKLFIWRCDYPPISTLAELLLMLGYGARDDGRMEP